MLRNELLLYVQKIVGDSHNVEDIVQDILLTSLEKKHQLKDESFYRQWIFRIARNKSIDFLKQNKHNCDSNLLNKSIKLESEPEIPIQSLALQQQNNYDILLNLYIKERKSIAEIIDYFSKMFPVVSSLSENYLQVFLLVHVDKLSQVKIAQQLNLPLATVKSRYQRSKKKIMQLYFECCNFEFDSRGNVVDYVKKREGMRTKC